jgi:hypothetical protein
MLVGVQRVVMLAIAGLLSASSCSSDRTASTTASSPSQVTANSTQSPTGSWSIVQKQTVGGQTWTLFEATGTDGGACFSVDPSIATSARAPTFEDRTYSCVAATQHPEPISVGWSEASVDSPLSSLAGTVRPDVAAVLMALDDGTSMNVQLVAGTFFVVVPRERRIAEMQVTTQTGDVRCPGSGTLPGAQSGDPVLALDFVCPPGA